MTPAVLQQRQYWQEPEREVKALQSERGYPEKCIGADHPPAAGGAAKLRGNRHVHPPPPALARPSFHHLYRFRQEPASPGGFVDVYYGQKVDNFADIRYSRLSPGRVRRSGPGKRGDVVGP